MFVKDADMTCLRQGDILKDIPYPLLDTVEIRLLAATLVADGGNPTAFRAAEIKYRDAPAWICQSITRIGFAAVISQCCDIEPHHGKIGQPTIAFARLVPVPPGPAKDSRRLESLRANKYPLDTNDPGYVNLYHIPACDVLDGREWVVDYNQVLSIPRSEFPAIMARKILQMSDDARIRFKIKLAASFGRLMPEEEASGHPWLVGGELQTGDLTAQENAGDAAEPHA